MVSSLSLIMMPLECSQLAELRHPLCQHINSVSPGLNHNLLMVDDIIDLVNFCLHVIDEQVLIYVANQFDHFSLF